MYEIVSDQLSLFPGSVAMAFPVRDDMVNPSWMEDPDLGDGPTGTLNQAETLFFQDLITQYLFPLDKNSEQEERIQMDLIDLRNKISFSYFLLNAIFVVTIFILQLNIDLISVPWPCGDNLRLEPIGFLFLIFFGLVMLLQTIGMIIHRTSTFLHIIASTTLQFFKKKDDYSTETVEDCIALAKYLGALKEEKEEDDDDDTSMRPGTSNDDSIGIKRRKTTVKRIEGHKKNSDILADNVTDAFAQRLMQLNTELQNSGQSSADIDEKVLGRTKTRNKYKSVRAINNIRKTTRGNKVQEVARQLEQEKVENAKSKPKPPPKAKKAKTPYSTGSGSSHNDAGVHMQTLGGESSTDPRHSCVSIAEEDDQNIEMRNAKDRGNSRLWGLPQ